MATDNYLLIAGIIDSPDFRRRVQISSVKNAMAVLQIQGRSVEFPYMRNVIAAPQDNGWLSQITYQVALDPNVLPQIDSVTGTFTGTDSVINEAVKVALPKFSVPPTK